MRLHCATTDLRVLADPSLDEQALQALLPGRVISIDAVAPNLEDVFVAAANNWLVSYENLSGLTPEQQDAFCTLATECNATVVLPLASGP